ncbi:beta-ketoacyl-[acyl-carrier-protein] synthase family protein [Streptomyces griseoviridis]|jgi:3-oxoacyl-[acyl-carrier-protein] synthase II|uniref:3-oxoacyl-[acyl-carrier-protein] synthase 2 n=3 Tax=Streptomyces TaxID=1883 RepID=A0A918L8H0_STRGD|nr:MULTISPECIES: beta-ketoacyl-[acyl-carrier-protein] synthase family protein [Streptomyces]MDP9681466.1 3-oxoacyl-[acyl-carrier-protein] synthase II [Streptomyces griseoviridis]GGS20831.1 3-oxoacyl-ACP synthase [Streptomyces niveoruber]GGS74379.1 3-oxoacyl-ACP synthase [Streptomyces griseoviridis]GGU44604.1 3-oxoacyl-ACP synthase [Streptomyces daghestanicus]GHI34542.1 3-oxoacyl-ACP synthase [Streptomyces daghestanicus]
MSTDIVITGLGATTPLGGDVRATWDALLAGRSGVSRMRDDWVERYGLPVRIAARLAVDPAGVLPRTEARRMDRCEQVAVIAARQAWADAGLGEDGVDRERLGVVLGTGIGGAATWLDQDRLLRTAGPRRVSPLTIPILMPNGPAAYVGLDLRARAGVHAPVSACASGAEALAWAFRMIRAGEADVVVAGGADACIHPLPMAGFAQARAMSTRNDEPEKASRPFDVSRDGFVLGEGAGVMVLERADFARARDARIHGRLAGVGTSSDGHHITAVDPEGHGQSRAIAAALRVAGLSRTDVRHVNCHATSTPAGDVTETVAIRRVIGDHPVLTAPKSSLGHLMGAAGAVEGVVTLLSVRDDIVPPTLNLVDPDPAVRLDVVTREPRRTGIGAAVSNSAGFGGHNVALIFTKA